MTTRTRNLASGLLLPLAVLGCEAAGDDEAVDQARDELQEGAVGTLGGLDGKCLDASDAANGERVQLWSCDGSDAQRWRIGKGGVLVGKHGRCLDASRSAPSIEGAPIAVWDCHGDANQRWTLTRGRLAGYAGKCVEIAGARAANGTAARLGRCDGAENQRWTFVVAGGAPPPVLIPTPATTRDVRQWPFASTSIWNMPLGADATFGATNFKDVPGGDVWAPMPQVDEEFIVLTPREPLTPVYYSSASWSGRDRCVATGSLLTRVPMPPNFLVSSSGENAGAAFLMPDGRTIVQMQPLARCKNGGHATSLVVFDSVDIEGDGRLGAHGGSGLSSIGGSLRLGELRPGKDAPRHALKVNVYAKAELVRCPNEKDCFRWPARTADGYADSWYGTAGSPSKEMKMGALLAIPRGVSVDGLGLETEPARKLAWTLQNYGAYVVDDTYGPAFAFSAAREPEGSFSDQFARDWGFPLAQRVRDASPWVRDVQRLRRALRVVTNNSASTIGGPGSRLQPMAPTL